MKLIATSLKGKVEEQRQGKRVRVPGLDESLADAGSEASVAASPCLGEVSSELAQEVAAIADLEEEEDEEEEENPDTQFKQKPRSPPPDASP